MSLEARAAAALLDGWQIQGRLQPLGEGLINDTLLVHAPAPQSEQWVLQRINARVFPDPELLMDNVARVVRHLRRTDPALVADLVATSSHAAYYVDGGGEYWRLWDFVADAETLESLATPGQAYSAGQTFARLQNALAGLPGPRLQVPIPGFMQMAHYLAQLDEQLARHPLLDVQSADAVEFIARRRTLAGELQPGNSYLHGDCKINNLLFRNDEACCVLDLDTVMWGHWALDFGDLVRSGADVGGRLSTQLYLALARGFVSQLELQADTQTLLVAPRYVGLMLGIRFLSDHLAGDRYFRVQQQGDNLVRALSQFDLVRQLESAEAEMRDVLRDVV